jgi:hypothetical protein
MATNVRIIHSRDYVRATPDGSLDRATSERLLAEVVTASHVLTDFDVILDMRRSQVTMTIADLWDLANYLTTLPEMRMHRIAVLPPEADFDRARFFALYAESRGMWVRAFASFEAAVDWFAQGRTEIAP